MQRLSGFDVLSRDRLRGLQRAWAGMEAAQKRYYRAALLHGQVGDSLAQLSVQFPATRHSSSVAPDAHTALVADTNCMWQLAQAEAFLRLDGEDAPPALNSAAAAAAVAAAASGTGVGVASAAAETTMFGLDWRTLSGAFRPITASAGNTNSRTLVSAPAPPAPSASFSEPAAVSAAASLLLPELETALRERAEQLWNDFDPSAEERSRAEQEITQVARNGGGSGGGGGGGAAPLSAGNGVATGTAAAVLADELAVFGKDLPPLVSSLHHGDVALPALVNHRIAQAQAHESAAQRIELLRARADAARQSSAVQALSLSAHLLADGQLGEGGASSSSSTVTAASPSSTAAATCPLGLAHASDVSQCFLSDKLAVLTAKVDKLSAEVRRDTYLGITEAQAARAHSSVSVATTAGGALIIPSLRVISSTLSEQRERRAREAAEKTRQLERVRALGPALSSVAQEMASLQQQIEHKRWSLQQISGGQGGEQMLRSGRPPRRSR